VTGVVDVQFQDHPPNATPGSDGAVKVTTVGAPLVVRGYVAVQTEAPSEVARAEPPQFMTFGVPVAEGAVISQLVVFNPALKTVSVTSSSGATVSGLHDPGTAGVVPLAGT
jgi:hypothetical protein